MLIAEDFLLLLTEDRTGRTQAPGDQLEMALGGATLIDLALLNKIGLTGAGDEGKPGRVIVRDHTPTGDAVLDHALEIASAHEGKRPATLIRPLSRHLRRTLYERLAQRGVVRAEEGKVLGVFPTHRWPAQDAAHEAQVRRLVTQVLVQQTTPDDRTAALIALSHALRCEHKVVDDGGLDVSRRQLRARAGQIATGDWAAAAVRTAVNEMIAAVAAGTAASVAAMNSN